MPTFNRVNSLKAAQAVVAIAEAELNDDEAVGMYVETYCNGREKGLMLRLGGYLSVALSEYRNNDDIVLYLGRDTDFDLAGNVPNERVGEKRLLVGTPDKYCRAAAFVIACVRAGDSLRQDFSEKRRDRLIANLLNGKYNEVTGLWDY